jgi:hypothetical protein
MTQKKASIAATLARLALALRDLRDREARESLAKVENLSEVLRKAHEAKGGSK